MLALVAHVFCISAKMQEEKKAQNISLCAREEESTKEAALMTVVRDELVDMLKQPEHVLAPALDGLSRDDLVRLMLDVRGLVQHQESKFARMLDIGSALGNAFHIDDLLNIIVEKTTELMDAERSTLFLIDEDTRELWSKIIQGSVNIEIRLQLGQGVAGWVALTGKSLNIQDAYRDPRFNPKVDENTGYITRNILCQPIRNLQGEIIGVIQVLNRLAGCFTDEDENLLSAIASQAAIAIENSKLYLSAIERNMELIEIKDKLEHKVGELDMLYGLERTISRATSFADMVESIFQKTLGLVHAGAALLTLRQKSNHHQAYMISDRGEWKSEWAFVANSLDALKGLSARSVRMRTTQVHVRELATQEVQCCFAQTAALVGVEVDNAIVVPLFDKDEVLGTFEVFNTIDVDEDGAVGFSEDDKKIITVVASHLSAALISRRRREEEEKNQRLASIGQMLSGVMHDFKNPMTVISGYVQLMSRADDKEMRKTYATSILKQFEQLNQMTHELLAFARGDRNILLRKVFIHKFMDDVSELLKPELASHRVELVFDLEWRNEVWLDEVKMKRAILNLGRNAAEAMAPEGGGQFTIKVWKDEGNQQIVFEFSDTGKGIPKDIRDELFESFVTYGKQDGTGLGLAIVKKIVEDHEGTIDFTTRPDQGTTFVVCLPAGASHRHKEKEKENQSIQHRGYA